MDDLVTIGTFSMLSGLSVAALRHYDESGLLKPETVDAQTGYRRYSRRQLERARSIAELRRIDLPLDEIRTALEADGEARHGLFERHRDRLRGRGQDVAAMVALTDRLLTEEAGMSGTREIRLVALNIGVDSEEELTTAASFWEAVLETPLEDWSGQGASRQARIGGEAHDFFLNLRVRREGEPHYGHRSAFGLAVADFEQFRERAIQAGAAEVYPPTESEEQPRHFLIRDPVGNRAVIWEDWQGAQ